MMVELDMFYDVFKRENITTMYDINCLVECTPDDIQKSLCEGDADVEAAHTPAMSRFFMWCSVIRSQAVCIYC